MKLLISCPSLGMAAHWQNVLSAAGIRTELRNIYLSSVAGDVPPQDCAAQVWLVNPAQEAQARALLDQAQHPPTGPDSAPCTVDTPMVVRADPAA